MGPLSMRVRVRAKREAAPMELPLRVRIEQGRFNSQLLLETADCAPLAADADGTPLLAVVAGAPLALRARALTTAGDLPVSAPALAALLMRQRRPHCCCTSAAPAPTAARSGSRIRTRW